VTFFEELSKFGEAMLEAPFAAARNLLAQDGERRDEHELQQSRWKIYDAWLKLLTDSANSLYASPGGGSSVRRSIDTSLKWQPLGSTMAGAFIAALWFIASSSRRATTSVRSSVNSAAEGNPTAGQGFGQFVCRYKATFSARRLS
jgi:hypothetical protein